MKKLFAILLVIPLLAFGAPNQNKMHNILMVVTSHSKLGDSKKKTGYYLSEVAHPYYVFTKNGFKVTVVSPQGGKAPMYAIDRSDKINTWFLDNPQAMSKVDNTLTPNQINPNDYIAIYFAGGTGTMWDFPNNKALQKITATIFENGGIVSADCHGPAALINVKLKNGKYLIAGKSLTAFSNHEELDSGFMKYVPFSLEDMLEQHGANYTAGPPYKRHIVINEHLVTGQNPASATGVAKAVVQLIEEMNP